MGCAPSSLTLQIEEKIPLPPTPPKDAEEGTADPSSVPLGIPPQQLDDAVAVHPQEGDHARESSAVIIQRCFRKFHAIQRFKKEYSWLIFQRIEYFAETSHLNLSQFYSKFSDNVSLLNLRIQQSKELLPNLTAEPPLAFSAVDVHTFIDEEKIKQLINTANNNEVIDVGEVLSILKQAASVLLVQPNFRHATVKNIGKITVVGDLHGSLCDLVAIFNKNGLPSHNNPYIFNGDIVDRGTNSLEVAIILLALQILHPFSVFINRGNHEDYLMNKRYSFEKEVIRKYNTKGKDVFWGFGYIFTTLPLGVVIDDKILVLHGGLCADLDISSLSRLDRTQVYSVLQIAYDQKDAELSSFSYDLNDSANDYYRLQRMKGQVFELLWNDPSSNSGMTANALRGGAKMFGSDMSKNILNRNGFQLLIRSHECIEKGFQFQHNNKVLTVFSSSNYYAQGSNVGAIIVIDDKLNTHPINYDVQILGKQLSSRKRVDMMEKTALEQLFSFIYQHKTSLRKKFQKADPNKTGCLSISVWTECMSTLPLGWVPWRSLCPIFASLNSSGLVIYESVFATHGGGVGDVVASLKSSQNPHSDQAFEMLDQLEFVFRVLDQDSSGFLTRGEIISAVDLLAEIKPDDTKVTREEADRFFDEMDLNKDGKVTFTEFLEALKLSRRK